MYPIVSNPSMDNQLSLGVPEEFRIEFLNSWPQSPHKHLLPGVWEIRRGADCLQNWVSESFPISFDECDSELSLRNRLRS